MNICNPAPRPMANSRPLKPGLAATTREAEITRIKKISADKENGFITTIKSMSEPAKNNTFLFLRNRSVNIVKSTREPVKNKMAEIREIKPEFHPGDLKASAGPRPQKSDTTSAVSGGCHVLYLASLALERRV